MTTEMFIETKYLKLGRWKIIYSNAVDGCLIAIADDDGSGHGDTSSNGSGELGNEGVGGGYVNGVDVITIQEDSGYVDGGCCGGKGGATDDCNSCGEMVDGDGG